MFEWIMSTQKMPFIIFVVANHSYGEVQKHAVALCKQHRLLGYTIALVVGEANGLDNAVADQIIELNSLARGAGLNAGFKCIKSVFQLSALLRSLKKEQGDVVLHTVGPRAGIIGRFAGFLAGVKKRVHSIYGFAFHKNQGSLASFFSCMLEMICAPLTSHFICASNSDVKIGAKKLPGFTEKYSLIRPMIAGVDHVVPACKVPAFPCVHESFVFGTSTQLPTHTNIMDLLKAFEYAYQHNQHIRLEIVGEGPLRLIVEQWIVRHHLDHVIELHGWHPEITSFIKRWHAYVSVLTHVGLPISCIEARCAKLPIVGYDTGGIRDIVFHGVNGFIHRENDWLSLAKSMLSISMDDLLHMTLQRYPDNFIDFEMTNVHKKFQNIYMSL
jgi:glycosyltransferase involved in cell wall biosynthesis